MKKLLLLLFLVLISFNAFGQGKLTNDTYKIGRKSTSVDKGFIFETNDGASNKKFTIEQSSKLLKFDGNQFRIGDGSAGNKELRFNTTGGTDASFLVDFTTEDLTFNKNGFTLGDGAATNKTFTFDIGGSNPIMTINASTNEFEFNKAVELNTQILKFGNGRIRYDGSDLLFSNNDGGLEEKIAPAADLATLLYPGKTAPVLNTARISSAAVVSLENEDFINGNCVIASSTFTCTFVTNYWNSDPACVMVGTDDQTNVRLLTTSTTTLSYLTRVASSGALTDRGISLICVGEKQ